MRLLRRSLLAASLPATAFAQATPCDLALFRPTPNLQGYRPRGGNWCAGFFEPLTSAGGFLVRPVSITAGAVRIGPKASDRLEIVLAAAPDQDVRLIGVGLPSQLFYRLDVSLPRGVHRFDVSLRDAVLHDAEIYNKVGFLAYVHQAGAERLYVPVQVGLGSAPARPFSLDVKVRADIEMRAVERRITQRGQELLAWAPISGPRMRPRFDVFSIEVPASIGAGNVDIEFRFFDETETRRRRDQFSLLLPNQ